MVKHLGIVGAGTLGSGIVQLAATAGIDVDWYDINDTVLRQAMERLKQSLNRSVQQGALAQERLADALPRLRLRTRISDLSHSDLIVEAVIEDLRTKKDLFKHLEAASKPNTILATSTSSLSVTAIASATKHPEKVAGLHFPTSVDQMKIVEIVKHNQTSEEACRQCSDFLKQVGKESVTVFDSPGFLIDRMAQPMFGEALRILGEHVADVGQIDRIMKAMGGFAQGPFELMDEFGLDAVLTTSQQMFDASCGEPRYRPHALLKRMVESGALGKKSGRGFTTGQKGSA
jgi:3-hydroxybutyryl-CoA dehydrogenase